MSYSASIDCELVSSVGDAGGEIAFGKSDDHTQLHLFSCVIIPGNTWL